MSIRSRTNFLEHIFESRSNRPRVLPIIFLKRRGTVVSYTIKNGIHHILFNNEEKFEIWTSPWRFRNFAPRIFDALVETDFPIQFGSFGVKSGVMCTIGASILCDTPSILCHRRICATNRRICVNLKNTVESLWQTVESLRHQQFLLFFGIFLKSSNHKSVR